MAESALLNYNRFTRNMNSKRAAARPSGATHGSPVLQLSSCVASQVSRIARTNVNRAGPTLEAGLTTSDPTLRATAVVMHAGRAMKGGTTRVGPARLRIHVHRGQVDRRHAGTCV